VKGRVVLTGDSLTVGSLTTLPELARARGIDLRSQAKAGRRIADGVEELPSVVGDRDLVVVALGTNDTADGLDAAGLDERIDSLMAVIPPVVPVVWLTVYRRDSPEAGVAAQAFNDALRRALDRYDNLSLGDWWGYATLHASYVGVDGIHLTAEGYDARTSWLVRQMAARLPPV
jgi:lysophospholipase L1-like esterase